MRMQPDAAGRPNAYHRLVGAHAPALNRLIVGIALGGIVALGLAFFVPWELALLGAWDTMTAVILAVVWHEIYRADADRTKHLATREDETRASAWVLINLACVGSLGGVAFALHRAN